MDAQLGEILVKGLRYERGRFENMDQTYFTKMMCDAGVHADQTLFKKVDTKGDGIITADEYLAAVMMCVPLAKRLEERFAKLEWSEEEFGANHPSIDKEHERLCDLINGVITATRAGTWANVCVALSELKNFAEVRFACLCVCVSVCYLSVCLPLSVCV